MKKLTLLISVVALTSLFSCTKEVSDDSFDLKASKMEQIGGLFESIARQPEMAALLISSTESLYSDYTELLPLSDQAIVQRGKARGYAFGMLFSSIARQPEAYNQLDAAAEKFLGKYDASYISDELSEITTTFAFTLLTEAIARQPEADSLFNAACKKYLNFEIGD
jgi:hypothetical protein